MKPEIEKKSKGQPQTLITSGIKLSQLSELQLLCLFGELGCELRKRGICRSGNNPVADYAEGLVAKALKLKPAKNSETGFDATDISGHRYEIKARRETSSSKATMLSAIRGIEKRHFDFLVAVIFNEDFTVRRAVRLTHKTVTKIARHREHVNAHIVIIRDMWDAEGAIDITNKLKASV